jgi:hypothetical protein
MRYLLLIYEDEARRSEMSKAEADGMMAAYYDFTDAVKESGHYLASEPLQPVETATSVRVRDGTRIVTDGPFAETKEQLGGFFLIEARDLDEAIDVATRIPGAETGCIEVRPIREIPPRGDLGQPKTKHVMPTEKEAEA